AYVADVDQKDWNEYAERLAFALNTAQDRVRGDMSFYLVHGWDPRSTLEAAIPLGSARRRDREPGRWRYHIQRHYQQAREPVNERLREAIQEKADRHNEATRPHKIEVGPQVWLYLDRVKERYARKLAHMWHGPFRVSEVVDLHAVRFEIAWSGYHVLPVVHVSKLKPVRRFPDCRIWGAELDEDEYKVERIADMRTARRTRYGRRLREFLIHWKDYEDPTWGYKADLNCGALLHDSLRDQINRS
ncbi:hypothetical protein L917_03354, partial [Phytophthora nicotianae]